MHSITLFRGRDGSVRASSALASGDLESVLHDLTGETEPFIAPLLDGVEAEAVRELARRLLVS